MYALIHHMPCLQLRTTELNKFVWPSMASLKMPWPVSKHDKQAIYIIRDNLYEPISEKFTFNFLRAKILAGPLKKTLKIRKYSYRLLSMSTEWLCSQNGAEALDSSAKRVQIYHWPIRAFFSTEKMMKKRPKLINILTVFLWSESSASILSSAFDSSK